MAHMSDYLENALINHVLRGIPFSSPPAVYLALFTSDPTDAGTGAEVAAPEYQRQQATFAAPSDGTTTNTDQINFPIAQSSWGTITHIGIFDARTGGNLLFHGPAEVSKAIEANDQYVIRTGTLQVTFK